MALKRPDRRVVKSATSKTLMGNQDACKGDFVARKKSKCVTFWVTEDQKRAISPYAAEHDMSVSRLILKPVTYY